MAFSKIHLTFYTFLIGQLFFFFDKSGCTFQNSAASALVLEDGEIRNSIFEKNKNSTTGGAIFSYGSLYIYNSTFYQNEVSDEGGAIYSAGELLYMENSTVIENSALHGGGVYAEGQLILVDSIISENNAGEIGGNGAGGGIYHISFNYNYLFICNNSVISRNSASSAGGVLTAHNLLGKNCRITWNSASTYGGLYFIPNKDFTEISGVELFYNTDSGEATQLGIYSVNPKFVLQISHSNFSQKNNLLSGNSSIDLRIEDLNSVILTNVNFYNSTFNSVIFETKAHFNSFSKWNNVNFVHPLTDSPLTCNNCELCPAFSSCQDCPEGCIMVGNKPFCISDKNQCGIGNCTFVENKLRKCECNEGFTGDVCYDKIQPPSEFAREMYVIVGSTVGGAIFIAVIIYIFKIWKKKKNSQKVDYQKLELNEEILVEM